MLLSSCAQKPAEVIVKTKVNCDIVPFIVPTPEQLDAMEREPVLHDLAVKLVKQYRVIELCKSTQ